MAEPKGDKKKEAKVKRPSALKRDMQNEKRCLRNRSYRAKVSTAIRGFEKALTQKESEDAIKSKLNVIFSLMDKGVKTGCYKLNKAARTKSRLASKLA